MVVVALLWMKMCKFVLTVIIALSMIYFMVVHFILLIHFVFNLTNGAMHDRASFLNELIYISDNSFSLSGGMRSSHDELQDIIIHVCTSQLAI